MKRWNKVIRHGLKKGVASLLVCLIVLVLPVLGLKQWKADANLLSSTNKATPLPAFVDRPADLHKNPPRLYKEPLITVTFDDGWETTYTIAAPILARDGIHSTQYVVTGLLDNPAYLSLDQVRALQADGQQIACHTVSHPDLTKIDAEELHEQLAGCRQFLIRQHIVATQDFAAPYGHTDPAVIKGISQVFRSERNTDGDLSNGINEADVNLDGNADPYNIIGVTVHDDTTVQQLKAAVDYTVAHNGWLVLTYHQSEEEGSKFSLDSGSLKKQLDYLSSTQVRIVSVGQVMDNLPPAPKGR
jgi:peptidoglycan/xylan/chitin deacetylase (PgdA/CDA1 family)